MLQRLLALLLLPRLNLQGFRRQARRFRLCNRRILQLDLIGEIVERRLRTDHGRVGLVDQSLVIGGVDLDQKFASLDPLKIIEGNFQDLSSHPAAQPCQIGPDIGIIGDLNPGITGPFIPVRGGHHDKAERGQHRNQGDREPAPETIGGKGRLRRRRNRWTWAGGGRSGLILLTHGIPQSLLTQAIEQRRSLPFMIARSCLRPSSPASGKDR